MVDQAQDERLKHGQQPRKNREILFTVKGMLTWDLNPTDRYDNGVFKHRKLQIQSRSIQRFLLWKPCSYNHWKPCSIHVVRPMSQVMYSCCSSNTMAGRPIDVETNTYDHLVVLYSYM